MPGSLKLLNFKIFKPSSSLQYMCVWTRSESWPQVASCTKASLLRHPPHVEVAVPLLCPWPFGRISYALV